ncbi:hypothetical protein CXG81DRAFT_1767, partial [Caulochytrium protostelioides]
ISTILGWSYFVAWSFSFYPQLFLNYQRKSAEGLTFDYVLLNVLGFGAYSIYTGSLYFSPFVRQLYREKVGGNPLVQQNDVGFAVHALVITSLTMVQCFYYASKLDRASASRALSLSRPVYYFVILATIFLACLCGLTAFNPQGYTLLLVYGFSAVKTLITFIKYVPQAWSNYRRRSTSGWSIGTCLADFAGGVFSIVQLFLDASIAGDFSGIRGNAPKLLLGVISLFFDVIFITQHYVLYR